jgi:hypothetical protein
MGRVGSAKPLAFKALYGNLPPLEFAARQNAAGEKHRMPVVSRIILAGLVCASLGGVSVARAQASGADNASGDTRGRLMHASKCVMSFGFGGGCDKDAPASKAGDRGSKGADGAVVTRASDDNSTRARFFHASKCVTTFGFGSGCDKDAPAGPRSASGPRAEAAPDTSTRGQLMHASKCVMSFGFLGDCEKK